MADFASIASFWLESDTIFGPYTRGFGSMSEWQTVNVLATTEKETLERRIVGPLPIYVASRRTKQNVTMRKVRTHELLVMQHPNPIQHQAVLVSPGFENRTKHQPTTVNTTANKRKGKTKHRKSLDRLTKSKCYLIPASGDQRQENDSQISRLSHNLAHSTDGGAMLIELYLMFPYTAWTLNPLVPNNRPPLIKYSIATVY